MWGGAWSCPGKLLCPRCTARLQYQYSDNAKPMQHTCSTGAMAVQSQHNANTTSRLRMLCASTIAMQDQSAACTLVAQYKPCENARQTPCPHVTFTTPSSYGGVRAQYQYDCNIGSASVRQQNNTSTRWCSEQRSSPRQHTDPQSSHGAAWVAQKLDNPSCHDKLGNRNNPANCFRCRSA